MRYLVLGMHRSGTSAVTGVMERLGCFVGAADDLMPAQPDNPRGFGERQDVFRLHEEVLGWLEAEWSSPGELRLDDLASARRGEFESRARSILAELEPHRPWVLKDPRLCLLLPLWLPLLDEFTQVIVYRDPLRVARSLERRNRIPVAVGLALWEQHNLELIGHARRHPSVLVAFEALLADPAGTARRLYEELAQRPGHGLRPPHEEAIRHFIDPELPASGDGEKPDSDEVEPSHKELMAAFQSGRILREDWQPPALGSGARRLLRIHAQERAALRATERAWQDANQRLLAHRDALQAELDSLLPGAGQPAPVSPCPEDSPPGDRLEELDRAVTLLLDSRRWRVGSRLAALFDLLTRRHAPDPGDHVRRILAELRSRRPDRRTSDERSRS